MLYVDPLPHRHVKTVIIFVIYFLTILRLTVTTGRGYLVPLDKLNLLSNFNLFLMVALCLFLLIFIFIGHYMI